MSGIGSLIGGILSSNATSSAASSISNASTLSALLNYETAQQSAARLQPYTSAGYGSLAQLQNITGTGAQGTAGIGQTLSNLSGGTVTGLTFNPTQAQLAATPGYQWNLNQAVQAAQNAGSLQGRGISGANQMGVLNAATNLANNTLTTQQGIFQSNLSNVLNPLEYLTTAGQNAAATTGTATQAGASSAGNALTSGATSAGTLNVLGSNYLSSGLQTLLSNAGNSISSIIG